MFARIAAILLACYALSVTGAPTRAGETFSWQEAYAKVLPHGDLEWTPMPFRFEKGASLRYIDFDAGNDENDGTTNQAPWKHHPWDSQATGKAKALSRYPHLCLQRRRRLPRRIERARGRQAWRPDPPHARSGLGSRPRGPLRIGTHHRLEEGCDAPRHPRAGESLVGRLELRAAQRVARPQGRRFPPHPAARTPNWKRSNPDDVKSEWWIWDNPGKPFGNTIKNAAGQQVHLGIDTKHIRDKPEDYFKGALIWPEFGWVMSQPYPTRVEVVDLKQNGLGFAGWTGGGTGGVIMRNMRYYLEDKPHYLDDPDGEFWFEKKGEGGRLYLRLPHDADPNVARVEAGKRPNLVNGEKVEHLDISGLTFRFTPSMWDLTSAPWDFSTTPWGVRPELHPGCVRVWGSGKGIRIANCLFEHVFFPIRIRALLEGQRVDDVRIEDNEFRDTDNGILSVEDGSGWGYAKLRGRLGDVRIYRNRSLETGTRPARYSSGTGISVAGARTVEIAGNVIERSYAQGIDVHGAKTSGMWGDVPFTRILIHHNKVWESMLNCNDYGGIETWQGGPAYVFDNLSYNAQGYRNWDHSTGNDPGFGHAYYLDGAFKNYHFNNIAWGKSKDAASPLANCSAFQEIISYQNTFFQNTVYNFHEGSRRQAPDAGRNKYLGNIWDGMGKYVFRHADPARTKAEGNARDAGPRRGHFALETNAYARNVFHDFAEMGILEPSGRWLLTFEDFKGTLQKNKGLLCELGEVSKTSPLRDPARGDFRPVQGAAGIDKGVKVFVPWSLCGVVGEWNFYPAGNDPTHLIDEHWYMTDYHVSRDEYYQRPMYPLKGVNVTQEDYVQGTLEDWIPGALSFSPARKQYATMSNTEMMKPFSFRDLKKSRHENARPEPCTIAGEALKNPQIYTSNLLIEVYFKTAPGHTGGVLMEKMKGNGYSLTVGAAGKLSFNVKGTSASATAESEVKCERRPVAPRHCRSRPAQRGR